MFNPAVVHGSAENVQLTRPPPHPSLPVWGSTRVRSAEASPPPLSCSVPPPCSVLPLPSLPADHCGRPAEMPVEAHAPSPAPQRGTRRGSRGGKRGRAQQARAAAVAAAAGIAAVKAGAADVLRLPGGAGGPPVRRGLRGRPAMGQRAAEQARGAGFGPNQNWSFGPRGGCIMKRRKEGAAMDATARRAGRSTPPGNVLDAALDGRPGGSGGGGATAAAARQWQ